MLTLAVFKENIVEANRFLVLHFGLFLFCLSPLKAHHIVVHAQYTLIIASSCRLQTLKLVYRTFQCDCTVNEDMLHVQGKVGHMLYFQRLIQV